MDPMLTIAFAGLTGSAVGVAAWTGLRLALAGGDDVRLRQRLRNEAVREAPKTDAKTRLKELLTKGGERFAKPFTSADGSGLDPLRKKLVQAGIYAKNAATFVVAGRVALLLVGLVVGYVLGEMTGYDPLMTVPAGGGIGYLLPKLWLAGRIKDNHKLLSYGLPDGLDLMVVCVEAGLTLDAAMQRVSEELQLAHPAFSRELSICHMETQIGLPRQQALKNLGDRTGFVPLQALCAMLIQADRFGTSVANALRVQSDGLRQHRQHKAEEASAKAVVKLSFPLVLFIFPASFLVMGGPMVINIMHNGFF